MKQFNLEEITAAGGKCQTRDGRPARIIYTDLDCSQSVVAVVTRNNGEGEQVYQYFTDGLYLRSGSRHDLIPLPKRIKREYWVNLYPNGNAGAPVKEKDVAEVLASFSRIACVKVVIDCEEGEGLEPKEPT